MNVTGGPRVSVVMNCYNADPFLKEALQSVYRQTFSDWEIVFWDNQSSDRSPEIVREFDDRIRYFRGDSFLPLGAARNEAVRRCRGELIAILDCDDLWLPDKLQNQVSRMDQDPSTGLVFSDCFIIDREGRETGIFFKRVPVPNGDIFFRLLTGRNFIPCSTVLVRKTVMEKTGGFDASLKYGEDYDLFIKISGMFGVSFINEPLAKYRLHGQNTGGTGVSGMTREALEIIKRAVSGKTGLSRRELRAVQFRRIALKGKLWFQLFKEFFSTREKSGFHG